MTRQLLLSGFFVVGVLSGSPASATGASYATAVSSTGNQFTAGNLHIADSLAAGATLSMIDLIGGDSFDAQLNIANTGSLTLIYAMTNSVTGAADLGTALQLTVRAKTTSLCAARDGAVLYTGTLAAAAIGDPAHGLQAGDRTLAGGATESLCFTVALPTSASPSLLGTSVAATFVFTAEQT